MGAFALILGLVATLCAIVGVVTALEVFPLLGPQLTTMFWLVLSAILFLATIALTTSSRSHD